LICAGLTVYYMRVCFPAEGTCVNRIVPVDIESLTPSVMTGELVCTGRAT